jgi:shikimate kinase
MLSGGRHSERPKGDEESALRSRIEELMTQRSATYEKTAHVIIDIDGKSIELIAEEILQKTS